MLSGRNFPSLSDLHDLPIFYHKITGTSLTGKFGSEFVSAMFRKIELENRLLISWNFLNRQRKSE